MKSLADITQFLHNPWFSRMWIVQEFVIGVSPNSFAFGNDDIVTFSDITIACAKLRNLIQNVPAALYSEMKRGFQLVMASQL